MKKVNHIAIVLDRSGSMQRIRQRTVDTINEQLDTLQDSEDNQDDRVTVVTFNGKVDGPRFFPLDERFALEDYDPRGSTALYDAIEKTVDMFQQIEVAEDEDVAYLLIIISDGDENSSSVSCERITSIVQELEAQDNWTFTFIGADRTCLNQMQSIFSVQNTSAFVATHDGTIAVSTKMSNSLREYKLGRSEGFRKTSTFYGNK